MPRTLFRLVTIGLPISLLLLGSLTTPGWRHSHVDGDHVHSHQHGHNPSNAAVIHQHAAQSAHHAHADSAIHTHAGHRHSHTHSHAHGHSHPHKSVLSQLTGHPASSAAEATHSHVHLTVLGFELTIPWGDWTSDIRTVDPPPGPVDGLTLPLAGRPGTPQPSGELLAVWQLIKSPMPPQRSSVPDAPLTAARHDLPKRGESRLQEPPPVPPPEQPLTPVNC